MIRRDQVAYIGIRGTVLALNRATGEELWRVRLGGWCFVNLVLDGDRVIATTRGKAFCLDAATGNLLWFNQLSGLGWGLATVVTVNAPSNGAAVNYAKIQQDQQAAAS